MKLTAIILLTACLHVSAGVVGQTVTIRVKNAPMKEVFRAIQKQTGLDLFVDEALLQKAGKVTMDVKDMPVPEVLNLCLKNEPLNYVISDGRIVIRLKPTAVFQSLDISRHPAPAFIDIHGRVLNEKGEPLAGASIKVKGNDAGTSTDHDGRFILRAGNNDVLVISSVGYQSREIRCNTDLGDIVLLLSNSKLDEVQVIAYGTTTRRWNTGSVSTVKGEELEKMPVTDPMMALEGKVPGLYITQSSGIPGANFRIRLRGQNSIASGNDPLYIVDGIPFTSTPVSGRNADALGTSAVAGEGQSPFNNLNVADIESIDVLKDADATAIYGSRGANGVILITTKKGKGGKTRFEVNAYSGWGKAANTVKLLDTRQYLAMRHEAMQNDGVTPGLADYDINGKWDTTRYTDWQKLMTGGTAQLTNIQASISGGSLQHQFNLRGAYTKQTTVFPGNFSDRKASVLFSAGHTSPDRKFRAAMSASFVKNMSILPPSTAFTDAIYLAPDAPALYDSAGKVNYAGRTFGVNPMAAAAGLSRSTTDNLIANTELGYELLPGLILKGTAGYNRMQSDQVNLQRFPDFPWPPGYNYIRRTSFGTTTVQTWNLEPQISYSRTLGKGKIDMLAGTTFQQTIRTGEGYDASGFSSDAEMETISAATTLRSGGSEFSNYKYNALFGRVSYNWQEKYLVNITARRDGSSRFGPGKQFGNFGAIGAAWIFSQERWATSHLSFLSFGKIRSSYGSTGIDQIKDYQFMSTYSYGYYPYQGQPGLYPTNMPNAEYRWELVKKLEIGLETGFFNNRLLFNLSYYRNRTSNQLVGYPLPSTTGFTNVIYNLPATVQNTGLEMELNTSVLAAKDVSWKSSVNISFPRNKLIAYPNLESSGYAGGFAIGESILSRPVYQYTGVNPETGLYTVLDVNKDNIYDARDRILRRMAWQDYFGGWQNTLSYKGLQLDIFLQFTKQTSTSFMDNFFMPGAKNTNVPIEVLDRWQKKGDKAAHQRFSTGTATTSNTAALYQGSDAFYADASFIRLRNLMLSYSFPNAWLKKARLSSLRIYLQGQNLLTITSYKGLDPETQGKYLPPLRVFTGGVQIAL